MEKKEAIRNAKNFDELLDIQYGKIGTELRDEFEEKAQSFVISELLKDARREANMTQEELANKIGTKKSYISRLENGKCDIQL
jgi:HTH-type transcriptional regulator/antitoxin HipB